MFLSNTRQNALGATDQEIFPRARRFRDRDLEADRVVVPGSDEGRKKSSVFRLQLLKGLGRQRRL